MGTGNNEKASSDADPACPLCGIRGSREFHEDKRRSFRQCGFCGLIFVPRCHHLTADAEKARYDLHQNSPQDAGYRAHLERLVMPLTRLLPSGSRGLDFGSGPVPVLANLFEQAGYSMTLYDIYYEPDLSVFGQQYNFITACEVVEHLRDPKKELERLWSCLKPDGTLGIMTQLADNRESFPRWHYQNDLTHVCYFSRQTFEWLAEHWGADVTFPHADVILLRKNNRGFAPVPVHAEDRIS